MTDGLKINFVLPGHGHNPVGGFKVVYEYANALARLGHTVTIVHPALLPANPSVSDRAISVLRYVYRKSTYRPATWFDVDPSVRLLWVPSAVARYVPDADVTIATAWRTAEWVAALPESKGRGFYLIQGLETWNGFANRVYATWKLPMTKIVIAKWLEKIADELGERSIFIPNGLDFKKFSLHISPESRDPNRAMMLYHHLELKGSKDGLAALALAREQAPDLTATLFGITPPPRNLPQWIRYYRRPSQERLRELYNEAAIFVGPSWAEGWPLPPAEAMMCGAALAATDIGGHREYAIHEETALLSPAKASKALAANIVRLARDNRFRCELAKRGHEYMQQFTWSRATEKLESVLRDGDSRCSAAL
jgi:glycosyltransferase involved in cell wall biosynthesis